MLEPSRRADLMNSRMTCTNSSGCEVRNVTGTAIAMMLRLWERRGDFLEDDAKEWWTLIENSERGFASLIVASSAFASGIDIVSAGNGL
jgi:hypothetical protein